MDSKSFCHSNEETDFLKPKQLKCSIGTILSLGYLLLGGSTEWCHYITGRTSSHIRIYLYVSYFNPSHFSLEDGCHAYSLDVLYLVPSVFLKVRLLFEQ